MEDEDLIREVPFHDLLEVLCKYRASATIPIVDAIEVRLPSLSGVEKNGAATETLAFAAPQGRGLNSAGWLYEEEDGRMIGPVGEGASPGWTRSADIWRAFKS
jgi:hypothetical protein